MSIVEDLAAELSIFDLTGDLTTYSEALGKMFAQTEELAGDNAWATIWDPDLAPSYALGWLAQIVGERLRMETTEAEARAQIKKTPNQYRGTPSAIANALKAVMTGAKRVWLKERFTGSVEDEDSLSIIIYSSETPDTKAAEEALRKSVPADIVPYLTVLATGTTTWTAVEGGSTWATIESAKGPTWTKIESATGVAGYTLYE